MNTPVKAWEETILLPTYAPPPPDPNPMFFEKRVNQGASGRIYPNPFTDHVNHEIKNDRPYQALFLENEYIKLSILPELGGHVFSALDKTNGYDFIYRQHVIKPGLIGLFGSWISGGMEFNWPLHHRPSTYMPVEYAIETDGDGSATIWLSEHEPMNRMKGMLGICMYPGKAYFEFKVQLFNRTPLPQPFLWWVNCAVHVNDDYQLVFPPDVESVTFHSRAFMTSYPVARHLYAGLDWREGVDISWLKNVDNATSYFANPSKYEFFGGYDHGKQAGIIHVANRHISPGKKLFTWGSGEFGNTWQRSLTDDDGPYVELMASVYSDNQPDFSWLQPYEARLFNQIWYPVQQIGVVKNANRYVAVNLEHHLLAVNATELFPGARILLQDGENILFEYEVDLAPGLPFKHQLEWDTGQYNTISLVVLDGEGAELIRYTPEKPKNEPLPPVAKPPKIPEKIASLEELYLTGLHVEQYLHFSLDPAPYWERALQLDPGDSRCNNALGRLALRRGDFQRAEALLRAAIQTLTIYNFNPYDGEPYYNLGLALVYQGRYDEAYTAFYKAIWSYAWQAPGYFALAQIDCRTGNFERAIEHLERSLSTNAYNNKAVNLKAAAYRGLGEFREALALARDAIAFDPLDHWAHNEQVLSLRALGKSARRESAELERILRLTPQNYLDLAFEYIQAGLYAEATGVLLRLVDRPAGTTQTNVAGAPIEAALYPMLYYTLGYCAEQSGNLEEARSWYAQGAQMPPDWCFPLRIEEQVILEAALADDPDDGMAAYYLGNLLYDKQQFERASSAWETATRTVPQFGIPWRNLSIAYFNKQHNPQAARRCYEQARKANPHDPRYLMEMDQLLQRLNASPEERLALLESSPELIGQRDDLSVDFAELYNQTGQPDKALQVLLNHHFHPWEGGEGRASSQYVTAMILRGQAAIQQGQSGQALELFQSALIFPKNLGEGRWMHSVEVTVWDNMAKAYRAAGDQTAEQDCYQKIIAAEKEWSAMLPYSGLTYTVAQAFRATGDEATARLKLTGLLEHAREMLAKEDEGGFFTSRPAMVVFDDDPQAQNKTHAHYLMGLAYKGLGNRAEARQAFAAALAISPYHWETRQALAEE